MTDEKRKELLEHLREEAIRDMDNSILELLTPWVLCPQCLGTRCDWSAGPPPDPCEACMGGGDVPITRLFEGVVDANAVLVLLRGLPEEIAPEHLPPPELGSNPSVADFGVSLGRAGLRLPFIAPSDARILEDYTKGRWPEKWGGSDVPSQ